MRRPHSSAVKAETQKEHFVVDLTPIKRLLLATDFSDCARRAEEYACALTASWRAELTVMTVVEFQPGLDREYAVNQVYLADRMYEATAGLAAFKDKLHRKGVQATTRVGTGLPSEEVIAAAQSEDADLIIVGTRGKSGLAHVLLGSTAERVIRMAPCPVLAVPMPKAEDQVGRAITLERILVPTDFSDCSLAAVQYARVVAGQAKASIELLHIMEPVSYGIDFTIESSDEREQKRTAATKKFEALSSEFAAAGIAAKASLYGGVPADAILKVAAQSESDLVVMGTHGRRGLSHMWAGSVTEAILRRGAIPVLAVRKPAFSRRIPGLSVEEARA
jgi:nucleotide-binding universal stress UspA family protein